MQTVDFGEYIRSLCKQKGLVRERVIQRSGIERTYGHQIFRGIREPSRDKVLQLAIGFGLNPEEAGKLLRIAGKSSLYPKIKRDAAILFCIQRGKTIIETQLLLEHLGFSQLGDKSC